jgi:FSR family fosmidomycin resistance protein-like MFS transporter
VIAMIPVLVGAVFLSRTLRYLSTLKASAHAEAELAGEDRPAAMGLLAVVIGVRSIAWFGLLAFVPLWLVAHGHSKADGGRLLFLMLLAGALGTLVLGPVADAIGLRRTLVLTQVAIPPLILLFVFVGGVPGIIAVMLVGVCVVGTYGITMVLSQLYLPRHVGIASGLAIGLAMGIGGVAAVVLGAVADAIDLKAALVISAVAPALGLVACLRLPAPTEGPGREPQRAIVLTAD